MRFEKIAFVSSNAREARLAVRRLRKRYSYTTVQSADVIVALGGDGFMLETLHANLDRDVPIYGMNRGTVGFLMNDYRENDLLERLDNAELAILHPLAMTARTVSGERHQALAINEVALLRQTRQAAKIRIHVDNKVRLDELICDGVLVATAAGSTAYNLSAHGPILPVGSDLLALTPISAFRPRRWRGALLPTRTKVKLTVRDPRKRPVSAVADYTEVRDVSEVVITDNRDISIGLLFDAEHNLEERILNEQFTP